MKKLIEAGEIKDPKKKRFCTTCEECGAKFEYEENDINDYSVDTGAYVVANHLAVPLHVNHRKISCPFCGHIQEHDPLDEINEKGLSKGGKLLIAGVATPVVIKD
jgi:transcription elongation factor Elf1